MTFEEQLLKAAEDGKLIPELIAVEGELFVSIHYGSGSFGWSMLRIIQNTGDQEALELIQDIEIVPIEEVFDTKSDTQH